jgi:hypothetical protein
MAELAGILHGPFDPRFLIRKNPIAPGIRHQLIPPIDGFSSPFINIISSGQTSMRTSPILYSPAGTKPAH